MVYKAFIYCNWYAHPSGKGTGTIARCPLGHLALSLAEALLQGRPGVGEPTRPSGLQ